MTHSIIDQPEFSVASTDIPMALEIEHAELVDDKPEHSSEIIESISDEARLLVNDEPEISSDLPANDELKSSNKESHNQSRPYGCGTAKTYSSGYLTREQREARLRQKAIELGEDPDKFVTITKKDKLDSIAFRDRMQTDARMCGYAKEAEEDPSEYMDMTVRERLISEEIIRRSLEEDGIISSWLDTDEDWKKTVNILQEN
ncbi:466_t:CDS:1, partial [Paraglomus occultum]